MDNRHLEDGRTCRMRWRIRRWAIAVKEKCEALPTHNHLWRANDKKSDSGPSSSKWFIRCLYLIKAQSHMPRTSIKAWPSIVCNLQILNNYRQNTSHFPHQAGSRSSSNPLTSFIRRQIPWRFPKGPGEWSSSAANAPRPTMSRNWR
jgi:hypothetical protein